MPIRSTIVAGRTTTAALLAGTLALAACGSPQPGPAAPAAGAPTEISVSLFGTFGYDEVGLFRQYEAENPGITIRYESTQGEDKYWPALQTRLASGSGVADVQGIEVARIADVVTNQADKWTDLRETPAKDAIGRYIDWKEKAATTPDGAVLGLGTDIGPMGICYRSDLLAQAGLPTDPAQLSAQMPDWNGFLALGEKYKAAAPAGSAWHDSAGGLYNAIISSQQEIYYDASGNLVYATNPAVRQGFDTAAKAGQAGLTPSWSSSWTPAGTRASAPGASPPSPARRG
jgi:cellobiose transport system substrate-binding protein